ncbi:ABC transporter permease [Halotia branconii]|uniref:ABC transporter permease n=1 Tax=Halotia branconii CENA392 TaxID=1539056 RepID=A0AAJ6NTC7_9CYAN|nr:ABC transporter permease [Halotia branconii]WGV26043.1 ABC transporter permease [Halotia branconii CENA392]
MGNQVVILVGTFVLLVTGLLLGYVLSQLVLGFLSFSPPILFGTLSLILIFGTLYYVLFWQLKREQTPVVSVERRVEVNEINETNEPTVENHLKDNLIAKLNGDVAAAERLIEQAKQDYPGMPESWYCERVLDDLERDQR